MDVQCERCKAEYEFDDALVSGRGTTVKCTSCGHQFKIRRASDRPDVIPDRWAVRTTEGREVVFTTLRELQKAILARQVGRADSLARGGGPARALGAIAELEPFFEEAADKSGSGRPPPAPKTVVGHTSAPPPPKNVPSRPPPPLASRAAPGLRPIPTPTPPPAGHPGGEAMRPRIDTLRPPVGEPAAPPPSTRTVPPAPGGAEAAALAQDPPAGSPTTLVGVPAPMAVPLATRAENTPPMPAGPYASEPPPMPLRGRLAQAAPVPARTAISSPPQASNRPPPPSIQPWQQAGGLPPPTAPVRVEGAHRDAMGSLDESEDLALPGASRRRGGWVVAAVLVVGAGIIGMAVAKPYLAAQSARASSTPALDPRAQKLLEDGERAMMSGDLDTANDDFVKASALAERDPRVLLDVARLATVRADVPWLRTKLLAADATDDRKETKVEEGDLAGRAKRAADDVGGASGADPAATTVVRIDALRVSGDDAGARALVSRVTQNGSQPETAYALAALDLDEAEPLWPMVLERLRIASAGEGDAGRARAALAYALVRSGDMAGARAEIDRLAGFARPHPLVSALRAFAAKAGPGKDGGAPATAASAAGSTKTVDVASLPRAAAASRGGGGAGGASAPSYSGANDPRLFLQQAESAKEAHDWDRARALYSSALAQNASDSEALAGLGDCDHASHDLPGAASYYKRALAVNPVYLPALVGLADVEWETGDKDEAQKTYHDITDRFPEGTYPARVRTRANDSSGGALAKPGAPADNATGARGPASDPTGAP